MINCAYKIVMTHNVQLITLLGIIFLLCCQFSSEGTDDWNVQKSKHFIIYYKDASRGYIDEVRTRAESYYRDITDYLGFRRFKFWTWEKRCSIYFYPNQEMYQDGGSGALWSRGSVHVIKKALVTYIDQQDFFDHILPHELGHIIFREAVGFDTYLPLWLDEAVAVLQEEDREKYIQSARKIVEEGQYVRLEQLSEIRDYKTIQPVIFYSESAGIIDFLLTQFGRDRFVDFCRRVRDGEDWKVALLRTYRFESLVALEEAWIESMVNGER